MGNKPEFADHLRTTCLTSRELEIARIRCKSTPAKTLRRSVYFIAGDSGPIKIGMASDIRRRLRELQRGSPVKLAVLAATEGGGLIECWYHQRFASHRLHGEWFERPPDILAEIDRLNTATPAPHIAGATTRERTGA